MEFTDVSTDNLKPKLTSHIIIAKQRKQRQNAENNLEIIQCIRCLSDSLSKMVVYLTECERPTNAPGSVQPNKNHPLGMLEIGQAIKKRDHAEDHYENIRLEYASTFHSCGGPFRNDDLLEQGLKGRDEVINKISQVMEGWQKRLAFRNLRLCSRFINSELNILLSF